MIEYYIKNSKNIRKDISALIKELKNYFLIEGISIENTTKYSKLELKKILSEEDYSSICSVMDTVEKNKTKYPFLEKYF